MRFGQTGRLALRSVLRTKVRTVMIVAALALGLGSLCALDTFGRGTAADSVSRFKNMLGAFDTAIVRPGAGKTRGMVSLTNVPPVIKFDDAEALATSVPSLAEVASLQNAFDIEVVHQDKVDTPAVFGVSANWQKVRAEPVGEGRFISEGDINARARSAVLGAGVAQLLFPDSAPLGATVRIAGVPFEVVGVLPSHGAGPTGASLDDVVYIPVTTAAARLFNRDYLTMLVLKLRDPERAEVAIADVRSLLRSRHHLAVAADDDFTITSPAAMVKTATQVRLRLTNLLSGVAMGVVAIASIILASLLLSSVSSRRGELGVARAIGATRADIVVQIMAESLWLAILGALIGVLVGVAAGAASARLAGLPVVIDGLVILRASALAVVVGICAGVLPAHRAATMSPAAALRT
jgi:putative ABC transport system permease protein